MSEDWMLSDEELTQAAYSVEDWGLVPMFRAIARAQAAKMVNWLDRPCAGGITVTDHEGTRPLQRKDCGHCWLKFRMDQDWQSLGVPQSVDHIADTGKKVVPTIDEMSGLVEDFTDGKPLKDYMDDLRGKVEG